MWKDVLNHKNLPDFMFLCTAVFTSQSRSQFGHLQIADLQVCSATGNFSLAYLYRSYKKAQSKPIFSICTASKRLAF